MKRILFAVFATALLLPLQAWALASATYDGSAKITCFAPDDAGKKLVKATLDGRELIRSALALGPSSTAVDDFYFGFDAGDGNYKIMNRCSNEPALTFAHFSSCVSAGSKASTHNDCSFIFDNWLKSEVTGQALCQSTTKDNKGAVSIKSSCEGAIDSEGLSPCKIEMKVTKRHKTPSDCFPN